MKKTEFVLAFVVMASLIASSSYAQHCIVCHGDPPVMERDCLASGCHDTIDNGNHHTTGPALAGVCTPCHSPNLVAEYDDENPLSSPASMVTPTVQSCDTCHKPHANPLAEWPPGDPYPFPIYGTDELEHMGWQGYSSECSLCHGDPPTWDPNDPYLIRYCETCHSPETLHLIPGHVPTCEPEPCEPVLPYGGYWYDENEFWTEITENDRCIACHGAGSPAPDTMSWVSQDVGTYDTKFSELVEADCRVCHGETTANRHHALVDCIDPSNSPAIDTNACGGMLPIVGARLGHARLMGTDFGDNGQLSLCGDYKVQMGPGDPDPWEDLPVVYWSDTLIDWALPPWTFAPYKYYNVRVTTPTGTSNLRNFYVLPTPTVDRIEDNSGKDAQGPLGSWLTVYSSPDGSQGTFSDAREKWYQDTLGGTCPDFFGSIYVVTFTSSSGRLCATVYDKWNKTGNKDSFKFRLQRLWEDVDGDYYRDASEPSNVDLALPGIPVGSYSVQVCLIVFSDTDGNGQFSGDEDTIHQVVKSKSDIVYDLTNDPMITRIIPRAQEPKKRIVIRGYNFGPSQGGSTVNIGRKVFDSSSSRIKLWSNTKIRVRIPNYRCDWFKGEESRKRRVWVTVGGVPSNKKTLTVIKPAICP